MRRKSPSLADTALQEICAAQPIVLMGLIAHLSGSALQQDIARTSRRLLQLGHDILGGRVDGDPQMKPREAPSLPAP
jgi:hypothetical protein